ncbi:MAG TPA: hypothetical protein VFU28_08365 [Vicinamibacterales bacterium]|nr:hypothetical protein [Vicinamibacterales bacterium]
MVGVFNWIASPPELQGTPTIPLSGVPHATTVMCNEAGTYVAYESDRFGFNNPDRQWDIPPQVALVGDSFVEGWCVPREESFAGRIRETVPATLSVGYTGHGPLAELGTIREFVEPRRPAQVFWFFYEGNDLTTDLPREMESAILCRYLEPEFSQQLEEHEAVLGEEMRRRYDSKLAQEPVAAAPSSSVMGIVKLRSSRRLINSVRIRPPHNAPEQTGDQLPLLRRILAEAKRTVEGWGGSLHFVYLPDLPLVVGESNPANHDRVLGVTAELGLDVVDLLPDFEKHSSPRSLFPYEEGRHLVRTLGLHYNAAGHRLVARRVLETLGKSANSIRHK